MRILIATLLFILAACGRGFEAAQPPLNSTVFVNQNLQPISNIESESQISDLKPFEITESAEQIIRAIVISKSESEIVIQTILTPNAGEAYNVLARLKIESNGNLITAAKEDTVYVNLKSGEAAESLSNYSQVTDVGCFDECNTVYVRVNVLSDKKIAGAWFSFVMNKKKMYELESASISLSKIMDFMEAVKKYSKYL